MAKVELEGELIVVDLTRFYMGLEFLTVDGVAVSEAIVSLEHSERTREIQVFKTNYGHCRITIEQIDEDSADGMSGG